jgi:hypothetical protein
LSGECRQVGLPIEVFPAENCCEFVVKWLHCSLV